ncbi:MAG: non-canonical purine NTP pyrophosphatase, partial [Candidatus Acidiferrales bacterium]
MRLYLASSNPGKLRELAALARAEGFELATVPGYEQVPPFPENEPSFALNALEKALYYSRNIALMNSPRLEPRGSGVVGGSAAGRDEHGPSGPALRDWAERARARDEEGRLGATGELVA